MTAGEGKRAHEAAEEGEAESSSAKRARLFNEALKEEKENMTIKDTTSEQLKNDDVFVECHKDLMKLDQECSAEQMKIQMKYEEKKRAIYTRRNEVIERYGLWGEIFVQFPDVKKYTNDEGLALIKSSLKKIVVNNFIDEYGSYEVIIVRN